MKLVEAKPISFLEVKQFLSERKKEAPGGELGYEQVNTLAYVEAFAQLSEAKEKDLRADLQKIAKLPETALSMFADLLPRREEEIKLILQAAKFELAEEQVKEITKIVKKYRKA